MRYNIEILEKTFHFKFVAGTSRGRYTTRRSWFVVLTSHEQPGVRGVGECAPLPDLSCDDLPDYREVLEDACRVVAVTGRTDFEELNPYPSMRFGLETALAQFRAEGSARLFDTPFGRGEQGIPVNGLVWMGTYDEMLTRIEEKMRQGFRCVKLKIGAIDFEREIDLIKHIRERFGKEQIELRVDANWAFAPGEAMGKLERLARYDIHSIEQPIGQKQWKEMAGLCAQSPIDIALDEELIGVNTTEGKRELLDALRPKYIILKPSLHGGMQGTEEWINLAQECGIGSWVTSALESNVGLNAIAHLTARMYGQNLQMPQGLGTGQLFTDNIPMPLEIRKDALWYLPNL